MTPMAYCRRRTSAGRKSLVPLGGCALTLAIDLPTSDPSGAAPCPKPAGEEDDEPERRGREPAGAARSAAQAAAALLGLQRDGARAIGTDALPRALNVADAALGIAARDVIG